MSKFVWVYEENWTEQDEMPLDWDCLNLEAAIRFIRDEQEEAEKPIPVQLVFANERFILT